MMYFQVFEKFEYLRQDTCKNKRTRWTKTDKKWAMRKNQWFLTMSFKNKKWKLFTSCTNVRGDIAESLSLLHTYVESNLFLVLIKEYYFMVAHDCCFYLLWCCMLHTSQVHWNTYFSSDSFVSSWESEKVTKFDKMFTWYLFRLKYKNNKTMKIDKIE